MRRRDDTDIFYLKLLGFEFPIDGKSPGFRPPTDFFEGPKEPRLLLALLQRRPGELCLLRRQKLRRRSTCRTSHPYPPHQAGQMQADLQERGAEAHLSNPQISPDGTLLLLVPTVIVRARTGQRAMPPPRAPIEHKSAP